MAGPSQYVRQKREEASARRLEVAKLLREDPATTNKQLAEKLDVSRNTIALDRKAIMEKIQNDTKTETELLRAELVAKLEGLMLEVEKHRKTDGKLSLAAIDQMLTITKAVIELTGARKPVVEKLEVKQRPAIQFRTVIVSTTTGVHSPAPSRVFETKEPRTLEAGDHENH